MLNQQSYKKFFLERFIKFFFIRVLCLGQESSISQDIKKNFQSRFFFQAQKVPS